MPVSAVRILLVDDFEPFRRVVVSILQKEPGLQVIAEAADGAEAVQKAQELQPDFIVLDIGLPKLSGIEAARRICQVSPASRILILSQESAAEVVQEALRVGASGYVVKSDAAGELLPAVRAILGGKQFVSARLARASAEPADFPWVGAEPLRRENKVISLAPSAMEAIRRHEVLFYSDDASLLEGFARFIRSALRAGSSAILVATESHRNSLLQHLHAGGLDMGAAIEQGRYLPLDVGDVLSQVMVNDWPDPVRFSHLAADLLRATAKPPKGERPRVVACGECAPFLLSEGKADAAIRLEQLWDDLAITTGLDVLCGYATKTFHRDGDKDSFQRVCAQHSAICSH